MAIFKCSTINASYSGHVCRTSLLISRFCRSNDTKSVSPSSCSGIQSTAAFTASHTSRTQQLPVSDALFHQACNRRLCNASHTCCKQMHTFIGCCALCNKCCRHKKISNYWSTRKSNSTIFLADSLKTEWKCYQNNCESYERGKPVKIFVNHFGLIF